MLRKIEEKAETYPETLKEVEKALSVDPGQLSFKMKNAAIDSTIQAQTVNIGDQYHYHGDSKELVFLGSGLSHPHPYVSRRFSLISKNKPDELLIFPGSSLLERMKVVLLSEAGGGKSVEIQKISYEYQKAGLRPAIIRLKNYDPLPNLILSEKDVAECENRVILFDGLDEANIVESSRTISNLAADYPNLRIVVSCRNNLYQNSLEGFTSFRLQKFSDEEINAFLGQVIPNQKQHFLDILPNPEIWEVFRTPFFLEKAVQYYKRNDSSLPENKIELLEFFVQESLNIRLGDISTIPDKKTLRERCRTALEKKALFFNKEKFVAAVRSVFDEFRVEKFSKGEVFHANRDYLKENKLPEKFPRFILHLINENLLLNKFQLIEKIENDWEWVSIRELKKYLDFQTEVQLNETEINYIKSWCDKHADDFLSGQTPTYGDIHFVYYTLKFEFCDYPLDTYLRMVGSGIQNSRLISGLKIISFIDKHNLVPPEIIEAKVLDSLKNRKVEWYELGLHFDYVKEKKIKKAVPILKTYIELGELGTRQDALNLYLAFGGGLDYLMNLTWKLHPSDPLEPRLIDFLILNRPEEILEVVKERFFSCQEKATKLRYAKQLIRLNQLEGLKYLAYYAETEKKYPFETFGEDMNIEFSDPKGIPLLLRLYNSGNNPSIPQDSFNNLSRFARPILFRLALSEGGQFYRQIHSYAIKYLHYHSLLNKLPAWMKGRFHPAFPATLDQLKYFLKELEQAYARDQKMRLQEALGVYQVLRKSSAYRHPE